MHEPDRASDPHPDQRQKPSAIQWGTDPLDTARRPHLPDSDLAHLRTERGSARGNAGSRLVLIHNHLREQLVQLRELVTELSDGRSDAAAVRGRINDLSMQQNYRRLGSFCGSYCRVLHVHHTIEDQAMFPELVSARQSLGPVVRQLESEHRVIAELLTALDTSLLSLVNGDGTLTDVREHVQDLDQMLRSHLDYEEEELVEPLNLLNIEV